MLNKYVAVDKELLEFLFQAIDSNAIHDMLVAESTIKTTMIPLVKIKSSETRTS